MLYLSLEKKIAFEVFFFPFKLFSLLFHFINNFKTQTLFHLLLFLFPLQIFVHYSSGCFGEKKKNPIEPLKHAISRPEPIHHPSQ